MKRNIIVLSLLSLCLVAIMLFASCNGGDGDGDSSPSELYNATGTWNVGWAPGANMGMLVLYLTQDASGTITGTVERATLTGGWDPGTITSGSNVNNAITITILMSDQMTIILEGTITDANNMSGSSRNYYGDPNTADTADWAATKAF
jgi:hypothetical protein